MFLILVSLSASCLSSNTPPIRTPASGALLSPNPLTSTGSSDNKEIPLPEKSDTSVLLSPSPVNSQEFKPTSEPTMSPSLKPTPAPTRTPVQSPSPKPSPTATPLQNEDSNLLPSINGSIMNI